MTESAPEPRPETRLDPALLPEPALLSASVRSPEPARPPLGRRLIPFGAAALMLLVGVFALSAQFWVPAAMHVNPEGRHGPDSRPWGQLIVFAAPPLLGGGLGIIATALFAESRRARNREPVVRLAVGLLAAAVGVAGWIAMFAPYLFPEAASFDADANDYSQQLLMLPWPFAVAPCGAWLLAVALLTLVALAVVPPLWHVAVNAGMVEDDGGPRSSPGRPAAGPSVRRAVVLGLVTAGAGACALLAPYLFANSSGTTAQSGTDAVPRYVPPGWTDLAPVLAPALLATAVIVLGWACLRAAVAPSHPATAEGEGAAEVPAGVEPGDARH